MLTTQAAPDERGLARGVAGLEIRIARRVNRLLGRKGRFWKERYHRRDLRAPTETRNALRYALLGVGRRTHGLLDPAEAPGRGERVR